MRTLFGGLTFFIIAAVTFFVLVNSTPVSAKPIVTIITLPGVFFGAAVNPQTDRLYVANFGLPDTPADVVVIDTRTNTVVTRIPVFEGAVGVAVNPITNRIYVGHNTTRAVAVIDGFSNSVIATIPLENGHPETLSVDPIRNRVYVANIGEGVAALDGESNSVLAVIPMGNITDVSVNPITNLVYASTRLDDLVHAIDGATFQLLATTYLTDGGNPSSLAAEPSTNRVYVANYATETLSVIDGGTNELMSHPPIELNAPNQVVVNPVRQRVYISNLGSNKVTVVDSRTNTPGHALSVGRPSWGIAIDPTSQFVYVTGGDDKIVIVED